MQVLCNADIPENVCRARYNEGPNVCLLDPGHDGPHHSMRHIISYHTEGGVMKPIRLEAVEVKWHDDGTLVEYREHPAQTFRPVAAVGGLGDAV